MCWSERCTVPACNVHGVEHAYVRISQNVGDFFFGESQVYLLNVKTIFILQWASRQPYTMIDTLIGDTRTTIYRDTVWNVTPEWRQNTRQKKLERDPAALLRSIICFWLLAFTLFFACPLSCLFCHFVVHQLDTSSWYGLTVPPANSNPVPSRIGLLPERMFVFVSFIIFSSCYLVLLSKY